MVVKLPQNQRRVTTIALKAVTTACGLRRLLGPRMGSGANALRHPSL